MFRLGVILLAVGCFCAGAVSFRYKMFPAAPFRIVRDAIAGPELNRFLANKEIKPRNTIFESFHPQADVVMLGDSLTQNAEWREIFPDVVIVNRGIGGDRSDDILRRLDTALEDNPKKVFLMFGVNDFAILQSVDAVFDNYRNVVEQLQAVHVEVYIQSTVECSRKTCEQMLDNIRDLNAKLKLYAAQQRIRFIDLNDGITSEEGLLKEYTFDGTHLLGNAYVHWADVIRPYVMAR
jgi:lysophospholipase L1-like esterase